VWRELETLGFESLNLRDVNQDKLENFFGCVRQVCGDNTNPTTLQYEAALKTVMLNKFSTRGIRGKNCEDDHSAFLSSLKAMLSSDTSVMEDFAGIVSRDFRIFPVATPGGTRRLDHQSDTENDSLTDYLRRNSTMYVAGQITEKLLLGSSCAGVAMLFGVMR